MQAPSKTRNTGPSFAARRGHIPQISINDDNHHVTEAIGHMYGDDDEADTRRYGRTSNGYGPSLSGAAVATQEQADPEPSPKRNSIPRKQIPDRRISNGNSVAAPQEERKPSMGRGYSWEKTNGSPSPPLELRERSPIETATSPFPLNDIDYESSPAAVAQELSNLHALRRMSMDVAAAGDPDLPSLNPAAMPASPSLSEDDSSRLFWVPARLHPELAPKEFRSFLDSKAEQIKRRSGELSAFSSQSSSRSGSLSVGDAGGLRRKKSMLSRQINSSSGYQDGAERLERKRSLSRRTGPSDPNLQELESLVSEGTAPQRSSLESSEATNGDIILPSIPGSSLKRSTRTTYRKDGRGSVKGRSERPSYAQRAGRRTAPGIGEDSSPLTPSAPDVPPVPSFPPSADISNLAQTLRDPASYSTSTRATNFSRPAAPGPSSTESTPRASFASTMDSLFTRPDDSPRTSTSSAPDSLNWPSTPNAQRRRSPEAQTHRQPIPQIVEVPPPEDPTAHEMASAVSSTPPVLHSQQPYIRHPERTSSKEDSQRAKTTTSTPQRPPMPPKQPSPVLTQRLPSRGNAAPPAQQHPQSLGDMSSHPSPLPGNDTNTGNLSFIPTLTEDKRADSKRVKDKKDDSKKSTWGWLLGKEEAEKEKSRAKSPKPPEKHDNTRLDVLQTSIEGNSKGRESLVLDRDGLRLEEERKKESQRKSVGSDNKKEKESLFSSIFGGKKAKAEKEISSKKHSNRGLSPEPPYRELKPDIDYNWTRFSILEERAIYRMAHIKLANPRRALYSQVLLSNFMYSYLAKVQQMHPQMNLPTSAKQQKKQQQAQPKEQPDEFTQYQRYQQQQQQQEQSSQPQPQPQQHQSYDSQQGYDGDQSNYDYDHSGQRPSSRGSKSGTDSGVSHGHGSSYGDQYSHHSPSQQYMSNTTAHQHEEDEEMW